MGRQFLGLLILFWISSATGLFAQNTGTVFSPDVGTGVEAVEARVTFDPDSDSFAKRLHYQYRFNDSFRLRGVVAYRSDEGSKWDYRYFRLEGLYQILDDETAGFDSGVRIEAQFADGDDPASRVRVGWSNRVNLNDEWELRGILLSGHQFGPESEDGFLLQTRAQISRAINSSVRLALDYYGDFNEVADMGSFGEQEHQLGPVVKFDVTDRLGGVFGVLRGISRSAPDFEYQLFFSYSL